MRSLPQTPHFAPAGEAVAKKRRVPSAKGFDFFVEASFVEMYNESCHDLLSKGPGVGAALPVGAHTGFLENMLTRSLCRELMV